MTSLATAWTSVGQHVVAAVDQRQRPGRRRPGRGWRAGCSRSGSPTSRSGRLNSAGRPGGQHEPDDVLGHQVVHEHVAGLPLQRRRISSGLSTGCALRRVDAHPAEDLELLVAARVGHVDLEQEPVALRLRQRVDALGLDRVLGRDDDERLAAPGRSVPPMETCFSAISSSIAACTLAGRAVDLVGEHEVDEDRAELDVEALLARPCRSGCRRCRRAPGRG